MGNHVRQVTTWIAATSSARSPPPASLPARPLRPAVPESRQQLRCRRDGPRPAGTDPGRPRPPDPRRRDARVHCAGPDHGEEISTEQFEGERAFLWTSFYTNCPDGVCPALILRLRRAQEYAAEKGFGDEAAFLPLTFDPERDTSQVLHEYAGQQGVDLNAGNWHFLRPESYEAGKELMMDSFGLKIEKTDGERYENLVRVPALRPDLAR